MLPAAARSLPDWTAMHRELNGKDLTLFLLWEEYKAAHPEGFQYSWFCEHYRAWAGKLDLVIRQPHCAGEALFLYHSDHTVQVIDPATGEPQEARVFVAVFSALSYTFPEATWMKSLSDWIASHQRAFSFLGGVPETLVPQKPQERPDPSPTLRARSQPSYAEMVAHYGLSVLPTRVAKPRDTAEVEVGRARRGPCATASSSA